MQRNKRSLLLPKQKKRGKLRNVLRWILYILCILLAFVSANTGDYLKPLWLIPIALCISSVSGLVISGGIGLACGLLMDISAGTLLGYHGLMLFLLCMATSVLYDRLMQQRFWNLVIFTAVSAFLVTGCDYIFCYAIWGYAHVSYLYFHYSLPCLFYTVISSMFCYPIFYGIHRGLLPQKKRTVEKTVKPPEE